MSALRAPACNGVNIGGSCEIVLFDTIKLSEQIFFFLRGTGLESHLCRGELTVRNDCHSDNSVLPPLYVHPEMIPLMSQYVLL